MKLTNKLAELSGKATKGPWRYDEPHQEIQAPYDESKYWVFVDKAISDYDYNLMVELRNSIDTLLEVIRIQGEAIKLADERTEGSPDDWRDDIRHILYETEQKVSALLEVGE